MNGYIRISKYPIVQTVEPQNISPEYIVEGLLFEMKTTFGPQHAFAPRSASAGARPWTCSAYTMPCLLVDRRPRQRASGRCRPRRPNQTTLTIRWGWPAPGASPSTSSSRTTRVLHQLRSPWLPRECSPSKRGLASSSGRRSRWWLRRQSQCRRRRMLRQSWQDQSHGPGRGALRHANRGT